MKKTVATLLTAMLVLTVGCDRAITIRQIPILFAARTDVAVYVSRSHPFVGETSYAPKVTITNSSDSPITVTGVELTARRVTYPNKPRRTGVYPLTVPPGNTEALDIWFDLHDNVEEAFNKQAELRVHYRSGKKEETAQANVLGSSIIGRPLDN